MLKRSEKLWREMSVGHQDNSDHPALPFVAMSRSTAQRLAVVPGAPSRIAVPLGSRRRRIDGVGRSVARSGASAAIFCAMRRNWQGKSGGMRHRSSRCCKKRAIFIQPSPSRCLSASLGTDNPQISSDSQLSSVGRPGSTSSVAASSMSPRITTPRSNGTDTMPAPRTSIEPLIATCGRAISRPLRFSRAIRSSPTSDANSPFRRASAMSSMLSALFPAPGPPRNSKPQSRSTIALACVHCIELTPVMGAL